MKTHISWVHGYLNRRCARGLLEPQALSTLDLALALAFRFLDVVQIGIGGQWDFIWVSRSLETHLSFGTGIDGVTFGSPELPGNPVRIPKSRTYYASLPKR
jgi:hypothetical protein